LKKISPILFYEALRDSGVEFYTGVPDSLLKSFCYYINETLSSDQHIIAANEGSALALGIGHHLSTGNVPLIYLQNSGLGNLVNPLLSLTDKDIYSIPGILMIGWRGEPGTKDEPQHKKQGRITLDLLDVMGIPYKVLDSSMNNDQVKKELEACVTKSKSENQIYALVVKKDFFEKYSIKQEESKYSLSRETAIGLVIKNSNVDRDDIYVCTTGLPSRELYDLRGKYGKFLDHDFLVVGGMGHANQIALGIALSQPDRRVICLDGDGAIIMHMGSMTTIGTSKQKNLLHIVLNNGAHDSVGGQKTTAFDVNLSDIAKNSGYENVFSVSNEEDLVKTLITIRSLKGPNFLEVRLKKGWRAEIGRPSTTPEENKASFMHHLSKKLNYD
jgi:phosphonopyruvate decarboxylase